jgi:hypothetical protein
VLQQGTNSYAGAQDTYLESWTPAKIAGSEIYLSARGDGAKAALIMFDLDSVPSSANVLSATLSLRVVSHSPASPLTLTAHRVLRPWTEAGASWSQADAGSPWDAPGAGAPSDIDLAPFGQLTLSADGVWADLNVTALAQEWVSQPANNWGVLLRGINQGSVQYNLASSQYSRLDWRPKLQVAYIVPAAGSTATPTRTSSPTATATATASATSSATPTATLTATITPTPSFTATATASATRTPTVTATATSSATVTPSVTATFTPILSPTPSSTPTPAATASFTATATPSMTHTASPAATATSSPTQTSTQTPAPTNTPTGTASATHTATATATVIASRTATPTASATYTETPTPATPTATCEVVISLSSARLNFGLVMQGQPQTREFTVSYPAIAGGCGVLEITDVSWANGAGFELESPQTFPVRIYYARNATFRVRFTPSRAGNYSAALALLSNASNADDAVMTLVGVGLGRIGLPLILHTGTAGAPPGP